jgi:hypothetical protein
LNIELFLTHAESKLGVPDVAKMLVKDVIQLWWQNFGRNKIPLPKGCPNNNQPDFGFKEL